MRIQSALILALGLTSFFESLALMIGMARSPWMTLSNKLLALSDIAMGALLCLSLLPILKNPPLQKGLLILLLLTNLFRELQYFTHWGLPFCANVALLIVNTVKLFLIFVLFFTLLSLFQN